MNDHGNGRGFGLWLGGNHLKPDKKTKCSYGNRLCRSLPNRTNKDVIRAKGFVSLTLFLLLLLVIFQGRKVDRKTDFEFNLVQSYERTLM